MPITVNEGGTLYTLDTVTANEGGTLYELDTVYSNEGGVIQTIHESGVKLSWTRSKSYDFTTTYENGINILDTDYTDVSETFTSSSFTLSKTSTLSVTKIIKKPTSESTAKKYWQYFSIGFQVFNSSNTLVWSFNDGNTSSTSSGVNSSSVSLNAGTYSIDATIGNAFMDGITLEVSIK